MNYDNRKKKNQAAKEASLLFCYCLFLVFIFQVFINVTWQNNVGYRLVGDPILVCRALSSFWMGIFVSSRFLCLSLSLFPVGLVI